MYDEVLYLKMFARSKACVLFKLFGNCKINHLIMWLFHVYVSKVFLLRLSKSKVSWWHHDDVIMGAKASQITSFTIVCSTTYSDANQRKHQSSASLAFVRGFHRGLVNSPHKWPITRKMFPFIDVIMIIPHGNSGGYCNGTGRNKADYISLNTYERLTEVH